MSNLGQPAIVLLPLITALSILRAHRSYPRWFPDSFRITSFSTQTMAAPRAASRRYLYDQQQNGSVVLIVLWTTFVALKLLALRLRGQKAFGSGWELAEACFASIGLVAFLLLCTWNISMLCSMHFTPSPRLTSSQVSVQSFTALENAGRRNEKQLSDGFKALYIFDVMFPVACVLQKLSLCCRHQPIFYVHAATRHATFGMIIFLAITETAWTVLSVVLCIPVSGAWSKYV